MGEVPLYRSRPFGVALLVAGVDETGPALYHTDPSGTFVKYEAKVRASLSLSRARSLSLSLSRSLSLSLSDNTASLSPPSLCLFLAALPPPFLPSSLPPFLPSSLPPSSLSLAF